MDHKQILVRLRNEVNEIIYSYENSLQLAYAQQQTKSDLRPNVNREMILYIQYSIVLYKAMLSTIDVLELELAKV
jgi:hypothetical protein